MSERYTKKELLAELRATERKLYASRKVREVRKLSDEDKGRFVASRLLLAHQIAKINTSLMRDIRERLDVRSGELREGLEALDASLSRLEKAVEWTDRLNTVLLSLGKVVGLI